MSEMECELVGLKPYQWMAIVDCGEPLVEIPADGFAFVLPHLYTQLGAPYGDKSPFYLRQGVCDRLQLAQRHLHEQNSDWRIQIFDAYRPVAVQQFMVDYTVGEVARQQGYDPEALTAAQRSSILAQVQQFWAVPSADPATPPPHSTGAAIDVTLVDGSGQPIDMGGAIDEISLRSFPDHFATSEDGIERQFHQHRQRLLECMAAAGFRQHPNEWWHFSFGDQMWAWLMSQSQPDQEWVARYGRV